MSVIDDDTTGQGSERAVDPRTHVYLSLYLVIFGFFVVLVNASEVSAPKSSAALASVKETLFQDKSQGVEAVVGDEGNRSSMARSILTEAKTLLDAAFPTSQFKHGNDGKELRVSLDVDLLFYPKTAAIKPDAQDAFASLASALSSHLVEKSILISVPRVSDNSAKKIAASDFDLRRARNVALFIAPEDGPTSIHVGYGLQPQPLMITLRTRDVTSSTAPGAWVR